MVYSEDKTDLKDHGLISDCTFSGKVGNRSDLFNELHYWACFVRASVSGKLGELK